MRLVCKVTRQHKQHLTGKHTLRTLNCEPFHSSPSLRSRQYATSAMGVCIGCCHSCQAQALRKSPAHQASVYKSSLSRFCRLVASAALVRPAPSRVNAIQCASCDCAGHAEFWHLMTCVGCNSNKHQHLIALQLSRVGDLSAGLRRPLGCCCVHLPQQQQLLLHETRLTLCTPVCIKQQTEPRYRMCACLLFACYAKRLPLGTDVRVV
jgi:hypothetical protein